MRRPQEPLSQRRLLAELRLALDMERPEDVRALAREHPIGVESSYVRHNLGQARVRALARCLRPGPRSFDQGIF